jgi:hypothetical protein
MDGDRRLGPRGNAPDAIFLIPTQPLPSDARPAASNAPPHDPAENSETFEFASHRRVWVDFRRGAAVMWTPSYYATWWTRVSEVMALGTLADNAPMRVGVALTMSSTPAELAATNVEQRLSGKVTCASFRRQSCPPRPPATDAAWSPATHPNWSVGTHEIASHPRP